MPTRPNLMPLGAMMAAVFAVLLSGMAYAQSSEDDQVFTHSVIIERPPDTVWSAIVTKALVDSYYFVPLSADLTEVDQDFHYGPGGQKMNVGRVLELRAPDTLKHSFRFGGADQPDSVVTYSRSVSPASRATSRMSS